MNLFQKHFLICTFLLFKIFTFGQSSLKIKNQFIIQFDSEASFQKSMEKIGKNKRNIFFNRIGSLNPIAVIKFDDEREILESDVLNLLSGVLLIQPDYLIESRQTPNDPFYASMQQGLRNIEADKLWDLSTGGTTKLGDTIVVAVLDDGFLLNHQDLLSNIFINRSEIPNNNIDDDQNGYVDDVKGLDLASETSNISPARHGTSVMGIIGAIGNNSNGITGVNWHVKLMPLSRAAGTGSSVSTIIKGYDYAGNMRKLYNETNGSKGAFVVATNLSAGLSNQFETDQPIWCNMYNVLGEKGVLSVGATDNSDTNVDIDGDIPSTCSSKYLLVVTNVDVNDKKPSNAAYGSIHVDLGAPGQGGFSTTYNSDNANALNLFSTFEGTSCATPHVAGGIALLYSTNISLNNNYKLNPSQSALNIKNAILNNVDKVSSLANITSTGGRLNLFNAFKNYVSDQTISANTISVLPNITSDFIRIRGLDLYNSDARVQIFNSFGQRLMSFDKSEIKNEHIQMGELNSGLYIIMIEQNASRIYFKIMKI